MIVPPLAEVGLDGGVDAALAALPAGPGIVQLVAAGDRNLVIGRGADVRAWAAARLGAGPKPKPGQRPPLDLRGVAVALRWSCPQTELGQLVAYERLMARHVSVVDRRDLKPPSWIHLDTSARFPRLTVTARPQGAATFGPFRTRASAQEVIDAVHRRWPLRPCDYDFEPAPELPLGLGCVFAQVRTCAAPCLGRVGEDAYRALARDVATALAGGRELELPGWIGPSDARGFAIEPRRDGDGFEVYPVGAGRVLDERAFVVRGRPESAFTWPDNVDDPGDWPWLSAWLHARKRRGTWVRDGDLAAHFVNNAR